MPRDKESVAEGVGFGLSGPFIGPPGRSRDEQLFGIRRPILAGICSFARLGIVVDNVRTLNVCEAPARHRTHALPDCSARIGQVGTGAPAQKVGPFAFRPSTAHHEEMGESCERCGRPGKPCSIQDPTKSGKWKILTLCDQCNGAIRQMDLRACKWFRRYCAPRYRATPIFKTNH